MYKLGRLAEPMGTTWLATSADGLGPLLAQLERDRSEQEVSVVQATALVPDRGAFVPLASREDAAALFLADVVVIWSDRLVEGYEQLLVDDLTQACFVAGESKTADIEQRLVSGVHGPAECIFVTVQ
jgi:L-lactate utilization protein LutC